MIREAQNVKHDPYGLRFTFYLLSVRVAMEQKVSFGHKFGHK